MFFLHYRYWQKKVEDSESIFYKIKQENPVIMCKVYKKVGARFKSNKLRTAYDGYDHFCSLQGILFFWNGLIYQQHKEWKINCQKIIDAKNIRYFNR
jgi:hypothetical protein